jgi:xanthine dehydrogenase accessory factor
MRDILKDVDQWIREGEPVALATVIHTWGSAPRKVGAKMAFTQSGKITGSVSGGCVESAVFEAGVQSLRSGQPQLLKFGVADETAWQVGLACGGQIKVFGQALDPTLFNLWKARLLSNQPFSVVSLIDGPGSFPGRVMLVSGGDAQLRLEQGLDEICIEKSRRALAEGRSQSIELDWQAGPVQAFIEVVKPTPTLIMVGGVHIAIALTTLAKTLGFQTLVIDPRRAFGNSARFPNVDRLIQSWPEEAFSQVAISGSDAVVMLTHDPKIDDPALKRVLNSQAFYIGALGSRATHAKRRRRLLEDGVTSAQLERMHAPIGLDIGAESPEEIALSIMAEIIAMQHNKEMPRSQTPDAALSQQTVKRIAS